MSNLSRLWPFPRSNRACQVSLKFGGVGHHVDVVVQFSPEKIKYWGRICLIANPILYAVCCTLPKLVILAVYLRVFIHRWSRIGCYATGAAIIAACITNLIVSIWQCSPADYVWNKTIANGYCRDDVQAHFRWGQFPNIVTDVAMLVLPLVCNTLRICFTGLLSATTIHYREDQRSISPWSLRFLVYEGEALTLFFITACRLESPYLRKNEGWPNRNLYRRQHVRFTLPSFPL